MTSHPPISSTSWHLSLPAGGGLTAIFFFVVLSLITPQVVSAQNAPKANSLIVWQASQTIQDVAGEIVAVGGRVDHIFPPNAAIVYVPSEKMADLKNRIAGLQIHQGAVELGDINQSTDAGPIAAAVWNAAFMKASAPPPSRKPGRLRRHPPNDVRIAPDRQVALDGSKLAAPVASNAPGFFDTSAYLIGSMTVGIMTPESTGSGENWSSSRQNLVVAKIVEGLQWWKDNALAPANLTFVYDIHHSVATTFEPITLSSSDEDLWISQVMSNLGYPGSSNQYFTQVRNYLNDRRNQLGTDWAFAIFIADSNNDNDGSFLDGSFAYAYLNGPFMVLTYDNDGWGINDSEIVIAHEHGHIWGALDEYASSGCTTSERSGYLNIANTNCEAEVSNPAPSIMGDASVQEFQAFPNHLVSLPARQMVGWRDSDGDGKERYDPVDTTVTAVLTHFSPDPTMDPTPTYTGYAFDTPFVSPTETDVTINFITSVEFRVDSGPWQLASAIDGAFDEDVEDFQFAPVLTSGTHTIQVRAINSVGNVSPIVSDTLTYVPSILDTETFVRQQYLDFLDREPDPGGFSGWVNALNSGLSKADLIEAFMNSGEFRFEGKFIAQSYLGILTRDADHAGFRGWLAALLAGVSREQIVQVFLDSGEFQSRFGSNLTNGQFVETMYNNILLRPLDSGGFNGWVQALNSGQVTRAQVALGFLDSGEFQNLSASQNRVDISLLYFDMLRRDPDAGGFSGWVGVLNSGAPLTSAIGAFINSPEYQARF